jgi:hypothetical protein
MYSDDEGGLPVPKGRRPSTVKAELAVPQISPELLERARDMTSCHNTVNGKHSLFTEARQKVLTEANKLLMPRAAQARYACIALPTLMDWIKHGETDLVDYAEHECPLTPYAAWYVEYMQAEGKTVADIMATWVSQATNPHKNDAWVAGATAIERKFPEEMGRKQALQVQQDTTTTLVIVERRDWQNVQPGKAPTTIETQFSPDTPALPSGDADAELHPAVSEPL